MNTEFRCSLQCKKQNPPLIGTASFRDLQIFVELPKPWPSPFLASPKLPPGLNTLVSEGHKKNFNISLLAFCDEQTKDYSDETRVFIGKQRFSRKISPFDWDKFRLPHSLVSDFIRTFLGLNESLKDFAKFRLPESTSKRDLFICAHAAHDACCGEFGSALVQNLRASSEIPDVGVYECSHMGGHRFAPTMIETPSMNCYGFLAPKEAIQVALRKGDAASLISKHYRGHLGVEPLDQVVEAEIFKELGWDWLEQRSATLTWEDKTKVEVLLDDALARKSVFLVSKGPEIFSTASCKDSEPKKQKTYLIQKLS